MEVGREYEFEDFFPNLWDSLSEIPDYIKEWREEFDKTAGMHDLYPKLKEKILDKHDEDLTKFLGDDWETLKTSGNTSLHCLIVLYNSFTNWKYECLSKIHKNQLLWASLMHDIVKRGKLYFEGKDHIHPFLSAAAWLRIFVNNDFIEEPFKEEAIELSKLVHDAFIEITDPKLLKKSKKKKNMTFCMQMHDHSKLSEIFEKLDKIWNQNEFIRNIFVLILFHQSIHGIKWYKPTAQLEDSDIVKYIPKEILPMIEILLFSDSKAYGLMGVAQETLDQNERQISEEIERIVNLYDAETNKSMI